MRLLALGLLFCAVIWMSISKSAIVIGKVAVGDGGVLRSIGTIEASYNGKTIEYEAYLGKAKYSCGIDMRELLLLSKGGQSLDNGLFEKILLGRNAVSFPSGLVYFKCPFGFLPMTCLGGVDCAKALDCPSLDFSRDSEPKRVALSFSGNNAMKQEFVLEIPDLLWERIP